MVHEAADSMPNGFPATTKDDPRLKAVSFGRQMRDTHFLFDPTFTPLNHGSFGAHPTYVKDRLLEVQSLCDARPDVFIRYELPDLLDQSRECLAKYLNVHVDDVVIINNASVGVNTVLRNLRFEEGDVIVHFSTVYSGVAKTVESLKETTPVQSVKVKLEYPMKDEVILERFRAAIRACREDGKKPRIAIFDTISAMPGVKMPWESLVNICAEEGVLSLVDGAHGAGQLDLDISRADPDFFVTNLHKWLFTPRATAAFYVHKRNQHLIRTTYPTSHGFMPLDTSNKDIIDSLPGGKPKSPFVKLFEFVGTNDTSAYLCIEAALKFREVACGGEANIRDYCTRIAHEAAQRAAEMWQTEIMETDSMHDSMMIQAALPLKLGEKADLKEEDGPAASNWLTRTLVKEHNTFALVFGHGGRLWIRMSGQIYLEMADFEKAFEQIGGLCERIKKEEWVR